MKRLVILLLAIFALNSYAQEYVTLEQECICDLTTSYIKPSDGAKRSRLSTKRGGYINVAYPDDMPDSLMVAIDMAKDVWNSFLPSGVTVNIQFLYTDLGNSDIRTEAQHHLMEDGFYYPTALFKALTHTDDSSLDAKIKINNKTVWNVGLSKSTTPVKNLSYSLLREIARVLGFGSFIKYNAKRDTFGFYIKNEKTKFESCLFSEDDIYLKDIFETERTKLRNFVKQANGYVYFGRKEESRIIYAPSTFEESKSLNRVLADGTLMSSKEQPTVDLVIDSLTTNILREIGWKSRTKTVKIIGEDIEDSGITSAYKKHIFHVTPSEGIEKPMWECCLPLKDGGVERLTSSNLTFVLPSITDDKYVHTIEGDINATITFKGIVGNDSVYDSYNLTLELKPSILKVNKVNIIPTDDPYLFDIDVDVYYEGSHYLDAYVEEEYSPIECAYFSDTPYYTRLHLKNVDSYGNAALYIKVKNRYGEENYSIDDLFENELNIEEDNSKLKQVKNEVSTINIGNQKVIILKVCDKGKTIIRKILAR